MQVPIARDSGLRSIVRVTPNHGLSFWGGQLGVCAHSRPRRDPRATAPLSVWSCVCSHATRSVSGRCMVHVNLLYCRGIVMASRLSSGTFLWGFCTLFAILPGSYDQGAVGGAGRLRPLGAPLPEIDPQRYRGRPMGPFTPCDSFWDHLLVYCKDPVSSQRFCQVT